MYQFMIGIDIVRANVDTPTLYQVTSNFKIKKYEEILCYILFENKIHSCILKEWFIINYSKYIRILHLECTFMPRKYKSSGKTKYGQ